VAQVVEADARDVGTGEVPVEQLADRLSMDRLTVVVREDRITEFDWVAVAPL
jgi:hypothetical protein